MGVRQFEDLDAWKLSSELKRLVFSVTSRAQVARDLDFCDQVRRSASAAPAHIAEGFGRYSLPEFLQYLRLARGSLHETRNWMLDGRDRGHVAGDELQALLETCNRAIGATTALATSLRRFLPPERDPANRAKRRRLK